MTALRDTLRAVGIGRLLYRLWHQPAAAVVRSRREGGPLQQWIDARSRRAMIAAAASLPPRPAAPGGAPEVTFLTGKKFWYQTAFCCWSLARAAGRNFTPVFVDDGTFDVALAEESARIFPGRRLVRREEIEPHLDIHLPQEKFPTLRSQRRTYIHLRKLTDVHAGRQGWGVVLDSDMLFFRAPAALLGWLHAPDRPIHLVDVQDSYGYPSETLRDLAGRVVPPRINVGILGLQREAIAWDKLESWCAALLARHGTSYYLEQALVALLLADAAPLRLREEDYIVFPNDAECRSPRAVLHHYVDLSKRGYFRHAWRQVWNP